MAQLEVSLPLASAQNIPGSRRWQKKPGAPDSTIAIQREFSGDSVEDPRVAGKDLSALSGSFTLPISLFSDGA